MSKMGKNQNFKEGNDFVDRFWQPVKDLRVCCHLSFTGEKANLANADLECQRYCPR
jgi:hypothetical protein